MRSVMRARHRNRKEQKVEIREPNYLKKDYLKRPVFIHLLALLYRWLSIISSWINIQRKEAPHKQRIFVRLDFICSTQRIHRTVLSFDY